MSRNYKFYNPNSIYFVTITINQPENYLFSTSHTDYLGSIMALSSETGNLVEKYHYDACPSAVALAKAEGRRMNPDNWDLPETRSLMLNRDYTGHEHNYRKFATCG